MKVLTKMKRGWLVARDLTVFIGVYLACNMVYGVVLGGHVATLDAWSQMVTMQFFSVVTLFVAYYLMIWLGRRVRLLPSWGLGLSVRGRGKEIVGGMLTAFFLYALGFGISWAVGWVRIEAVHLSWPSLMSALFMFFLVAVYEEVLLRGVVLGKMLDAKVSKFHALLFSSVLFSALHLMNPNFSWLPFINILLAGVLLGVSYIYTRNLWFPIFLHWFWNWLQGPVLGYGVSGMDMGQTLFELSFFGPDMACGRFFGFEGTWLCSCLMILFIGLIFWKYEKKAP